MAKSKKRKKPRASKTQHRILNREQISVTVEAEYIISRAKKHDSLSRNLTEIMLYIDF